jgi:hypothetical protein
MDDDANLTWREGSLGWNIPALFQFLDHLIRVLALVNDNLWRTKARPIPPNSAR